MDIEISADDKLSVDGVISNKTMEARIVGIDIPFINLVLFLVKLSIAAIPAAIIVAIVWLTTVGLLGGLLVGIAEGLNI